jgi:hypothetical protein
MIVRELKELLVTRNARWSVSHNIPDESDIDSIIHHMPLGALIPPAGTINARYPRLRRTRQDKYKIWQPGMNRFQRPVYKKLPNSWDWRFVDEKNWISPVKNQGNCGSCVAFAVAAAMESHCRINESNEKLKTNISEAGIFFIPERQCNPGDPRYGWAIPAALDFLIDEGACFEDNYPYKDMNHNAELIEGTMLTIKITGYDSSSSSKQMKRWLCEEGPLISMFTVYDDFYLFWHGGANGIYSNVAGDIQGGHAITVIGYDDANSCWICKNSWGSVHGNDGCFRIGYGECGIDKRMYLMEDVYNIHNREESSYDPRKLRIIKKGWKGWLLTDGTINIKMLSNKEDALNALRIAKRYKKHGFIGRDNRRIINRSKYITEYWSGNSKLSHEPLTKVDCISYNPANVVAEDLDARGWIIREGDRRLLWAHDMNDALTALCVVERYNKMCFVGRNNKRLKKNSYIMTYWE